MFASHRETKSPMRTMDRSPLKNGTRKMVYISSESQIQFVPPNGYASVLQCLHVYMYVQNVKKRKYAIAFIHLDMNIWILRPQAQPNANEKR